MDKRKLPRTIEIKQKISNSLRGHKQSKEVRIKIANKLKGQKRTKEVKTKMSKALKGRKILWSNKISKALKGRKLSTGHIKKLSESHKGIKQTEKSKKKISEALKGEKSYLWRGGITNNPYTIDWTETLRRSIRERDNYICQLCSQYGNIVHHKDYDKKNCNPDNLITLCKKCHAKTSFNREYWINYFYGK